ncbi:hypothetical protein HY413_01730 [Candidatus Kaiserbacteria bacterium]|nr:hypothetical protein [Candidatus Kaiserbacteria bacterium]
MDQTTISWRATEHQHIERGNDWYWALGVIAVSSAVTAILFNNILFALLIVIAAATLGMIAARPPSIADFVLGERGLLINDALYPYEEMFAFWVTEDEQPILLIDTPRIMTPDLVIPLHDVDAASVRTFLQARVHEVPLREPFLYRVMEFFGF